MAAVISSQGPRRERGALRLAGWRVETSGNGVFPTVAGGVQGGGLVRTRFDRGRP